MLASSKIGFVNVDVLLKRRGSRMACQPCVSAYQVEGKGAEVGMGMRWDAWLCRIDGRRLQVGVVSMQVFSSSQIREARIRCQIRCGG